MIALAGNHDLVACLLLRHLIYGGRAEDLTDDVMLDILRWRSDGGASTLEDFQKLSIPDRIYRANRHIAIDCGCMFGGHLGAICLEAGEEFYV